jgi:hypothetical protein
LELSGDDAARTHAKIYIGELLREGAASGWDMQRWRLIVTDANDVVVADLPVSVTSIAN